MNNSPKRSHPRNLAELLVPLAVLLLLLAYSYMRFFAQPYLGFQVNASTGDIVDVYVPQPLSPRLEAGDQLISINGRLFSTYLRNMGYSLSEGVTPGQRVDVQVQSATGLKTIKWIIPGFQSGEFFARLLNTWVLSYVFWIAGTATILLVRPKDQRRTLLAAFYYITAIWLMAGSISSSAMWMTQYVLRAAMWVSLPIYLHLHWAFPRSLQGKPSIWLSLFYGASIFLGLLSLAGVLPRDVYILPFAAAIFGSAILLIIRTIYDKPYRRQLGFMLFAFGLAFAPALLLAALSAGVGVPAVFGGTVFSLLAFPGAYFYVVYRRQLGGAELRANRVISFYLFLVLLVTLFLGLSPLFSSYFTSLSGAGAVILVTGGVTALLSVFGFSRFQRFVERRFLRIPQPPDNLLSVFSGRLSTSVTTDHLVGLLQKEILPSLLIRRSALVKLGLGQSRVSSIYLQDLASTDLPSVRQQRELLDSALANPVGIYAPDDHAWLRLVVPVRVGSDASGLWLLGRKDPDDYYSYAESTLLRSLADQMAIALTNIDQALSLRKLYQIDIERQEDERAHLARELHDDILNEINTLLTEAEQELGSRDLQEKHRLLDDRIRRLIDGLRPPLLDYGLYRAFTHLTDELTQKTKGASIRLSIPATEIRYDHKIEEHVYRIVQQAAENGLEHGKAEYVLISGALEPGSLKILVEDDGVGFRNEGMELSRLLGAKHYGLASMSERAALIGARLQVTSVPRRGTQVNLSWKQQS